MVQSLFTSIILKCIFQFFSKAFKNCQNCENACINFFNHYIRTWQLFKNESGDRCSFSHSPSQSKERPSLNRIPFYQAIRHHLNKTICQRSQITRLTWSKKNCSYIHSTVKVENTNRVARNLFLQRDHFHYKCKHRLHNNLFWGSQCIWRAYNINHVTSRLITSWFQDGCSKYR